MTFAAFPQPKDPRDVAWYKVKFFEPLAAVFSGDVVNIDLGDPDPLLVTDVQVTADGAAVAFLAAGGTPGCVYVIEFTVETVIGSRLNRAVKLAVADL